MKSGIYEIVNLVNGKRYVGSAKDFKVRWAKHLGDLRRGRHHSVYLQRSWDQHGEAAFSFKVVELCDVSDLIAREQDWLDNSNPEYNISPTAGNCTGVKHSEASKLKRSIATKGRKASPESVAKRVGQKRTAEQCARISAALKLAFERLSPEQKISRAAKIAAANRNRCLGRKQSADLIAKRSAAMRGHVVSEETRQKLSAANKGKAPSAKTMAAAMAANKGVKRSEEFCKKCRDRKASEETKKKMSEAQKGRKVSDETRAKIAAAHKGSKLSPESIAKRTTTRAANGGYVVSDENKKELSVAMRAYWLRKKEQSALDTEDTPQKPASAGFVFLESL